jgi:RNA polymerase sigma-70 factor (ECF subfamily)
MAMQRGDMRMLHEAIAALPAAFREAIVLRELEGLSYREIAGVAGVPVGTVMSRLARARRLLAQSLRAIAQASHRSVT